MTLKEVFKSLDVKTIIIIILTLVLIIAIIAGQKGYMNDNKSVIDNLHSDNQKLQTKIDSLKNENNMYDRILTKLDERTKSIELKQDKIDNDIQKLKNLRSGIPTKVNAMEATEIAKEFELYLNKKK